MKKAIHFIFSLHRILGTFIALFFFMWFVSGLILLYHPYPRLPEKQVYKMMETLPDSLPDIQRYLIDGADTPKNIRLRQFQEQTLLSYTLRDSDYLFCADCLQTVKTIQYKTIEQIAQRWIQAPVKRVDTLHQRVQWILYSRYEKALPIYRFYFDDPDRHELFISGKTGEPQQLTNASSRIWAWAGAIPHKFYLPFIRKDVSIWTSSITIGGIICLIAALTGLYLGIHILLKRYKKLKTWSNPYQKRWYKWHYLSGLIFGVFLVAWGISGTISMQRVPQWIIPVQGDYIFNPSRLWGKQPLPLSAYRLDYRLLKQKYPELKEISWTHFRDIPVYRIIESDKEHFIDASSSAIKSLYIPEEAITAGIRLIHGPDIKFHLSLLEHYDNYYLSRDRSLALPVYKIKVDNDDQSLYYINPETGYIRYLNKNKMVRKWLFSGIHYLNIQWLIERPVIWTISIWLLCLGGAFVSLSGIWLGLKYLKRWYRRSQKRP